MVSLPLCIILYFADFLVSSRQSVPPRETKTVLVTLSSVTAVC